MDDEPKTVKELLVELKDASELMVDLAYAAVFFNEEKLAREVGRLEERMNGHLRRLRIMAMLAARSPEDAEGMAGVLWIADAIERIGDAASDIARVVAASRWRVGIIATGGLSHFPELSLPRVGETDTVFDRKLIHWMERGEHEPLRELTVGELHKTGEHEFLNWMVLLGAVTPARARVRYFGELPRINLAAVEWSLP